MGRKSPDTGYIIVDIKKNSNFKPRFNRKNLTREPIEFLLTITEMQLI